MPAPGALAVRVPFYHTAAPVDDDTPADAPVLITHVTVEVITFGERFFWLHVSEAPAEQCVPRLGACSVAVGLSLRGADTPSSVSSSQLMAYEAARPQDSSAGTNTSAQSVFATALSKRLVRGVAKRFGAQVIVYVNCAIEGERCQSLLGTDGGGGFSMTYQFGGLVYREAFALLARRLEGHAGP